MAAARVDDGDLIMSVVGGGEKSRIPVLFSSSIESESGSNNSTAMDDVLGLSSFRCFLLA